MLESMVAIQKNIPLYKHLSKSKNYKLPTPLLNVINGGVHAKNNLEIQEFMIRPEKTSSFSESLRRSFIVIQNLKGMVNNTSVGDEGGFAPNLENDEKAIDLIIKAIEKSGFKPGDEISICLDVAANELKKNKTLDYYSQIIKKYPIRSIEDPFKEDDWESWKKLSKNTNSKSHPGASAGDSGSPPSPQKRRFPKFKNYYYYYYYYYY